MSMSVVLLLLSFVLSLLAQIASAGLARRSGVADFGRIRPAHLNAVIYGWRSLAGVGVALWLIPRLLKTELVGGATPSPGRNHGEQPLCQFTHTEWPHFYLDLKTSRRLAPQRTSA
jgi:hypothetical protein